MWIVEKYLTLKLINKQKVTRYKLRQLVNNFLFESLGEKLSIASFYRLSRELEDKGLIQLEPEILQSKHKKLGYWVSSKDIVIERCYLSVAGEHELKKLEAILKVMLL